MMIQDFIFVLCFGLFSEAIWNQDMTSDSKERYSDASLVTWAHAVNSHQALEEELEGFVNFLEADVSLGHVLGNEVGPPIPIMAHPPEVTSDISLERWLDIVIARQSGKGLKLDFKSIDIVKPSLHTLQRHKEKLQFPLWLNADILPGPVLSYTTPVSPEEFLTLCQEYFPNATLSVGWTTYWIPTYAKKNWHYNWKHVRQMVDTLKCFGNIHSMTFPVRGIFASRSIAQLKWLLEIFPQSTLTVWSGRLDPLELYDLKRIRESFPRSRVFYDIPEKIGRRFREKKEEIEIKPQEEPTFLDRSYVKMTKVQGNRTSDCSSNSYVTSRAIMFGKGSETLVSLKEMFVPTEGTPLKAEGEVIFFGNGSSTQMDEQPQLILSLTEVKSFSKNFSSQVEDDMDIPWVAMKSSRLHVFKHDGTAGDTSCYFFHLDTTSKKPFQAWNVDCDQMREDRAEALSSGKTQISSRKRLVLPPGPFVFGVISSGGSYVMVNDLTVKGGIFPTPNSGTAFALFSKPAFLGIALACFTLLYTFYTDI